MMPRRSQSPFKAVSFTPDADAVAEMQLSRSTPTTVVASAKAPPTYGTYVGGGTYGGHSAALWHDPSYSFANRFARQAAHQMAEDARDPTMTKNSKVHATDDQRASCAQHLRELVCDLPVEGVEHELRPHMVQFWQDTIYQAEPNYPDYHPASRRTLEEAKDLHKCATNKRKLKLIKPLIKPKAKPAPSGPTEDPQYAGDVRDVYSPTSAGDAASLMAGGRFGLETPLTADHLVGLFHPEEFGAMDDSAAFEAYGGPTQQTLYGWTSPAGPRYTTSETNKASSKAQDQGMDDDEEMSPDNLPARDGSPARSIVNTGGGSSPARDGSPTRNGSPGGGLSDDGDDDEQ